MSITLQSGTLASLDEIVEAVETYVAAGFQNSLTSPTSAAQVDNTGH
ncbi:MAG: hypothetical protein M3445_07860 [Actinomycetota bacterium]|nr:hypothetical protein [Actinomycetota bacterium]